MESKGKYRQIIDDLREINRAIHMKHHELAKKYSLTHDQFHLLIHLDNKKNIPTIGQIASWSGKAQNTISEMVTRLEEKNLLKRVKDKKDRRISRVMMTEESIKLIEKISYEARYEFVFEALRRLDEDMVNNLSEGLKELLEKLKEE